VTGDSLSDSGYPVPRGSETGAPLSGTRIRNNATWADEYARNLGGLRTHFASDAGINTPTRIFGGHAGVVSLYQGSFATLPEINADAQAAFAGCSAHCFAYSAVPSDAVANNWPIEYTHLLVLDRGFTSRLRSFEAFLELAPGVGRVQRGETGCSPTTPSVGPKQLKKIIARRLMRARIYLPRDVARTAGCRGTP
jgi:hypothetical protein